MRGEKALKALKNTADKLYWAEKGFALRPNSPRLGSLLFVWHHIDCIFISILQIYVFAKRFTCMVKSS
jgi:hypothetical protein